MPSQTELLFDLGLDKEIIGITRYCIHPADKVEGKGKIGGTKRFDIDKIAALKPDLIIGNKEENYEEGIFELQKICPVWMSDIFTLKDAISMMREIGSITGKQNESDNLIHEIETGLVPNSSRLHKTCAYFIWRRPYMVAAKNTFIDNMLSVFGLRNTFEEKERYPEVSIDEIGETRPDFIFLSSEPYSFTDKHIPEFNEICPTAKVVVVDGEMFSWYGSRLKLTGAYFQQLRQQLGIVS